MNHSNMHHLRHPSGLEYTLTDMTVEEGRLLVAEKEGRYLEALSMPDIGNQVYHIESEDKIAVISPTETLIYSPAQGYFLQVADYEKEQAIHKARTTKRIVTEYPRPRVLYTYDFSEIHYREVRPEQAGELARKGTARMVWEGNIPENQITLLELPGGDLLRYSVTTGRNFQTIHRGQIFESEEDAKQYQSHESHGYRTINNFCPYIAGHNVLGEAFPDHERDLIHQLGEITRLNADNFGFDYKEMWCIQDRLREEVFTDQWVHRIFLPLTAYLGRARINRKGGLWKMEFNEHWQTWVPFIVEENRKIHLSNMLYSKTLNPNNEQYSYIDNAIFG